MTAPSVSPVAFLIAALCVWRVTHLFNAEDGPGHLLAWLRRRAGSGWTAELLDCFYCLSLWVAAPASLLVGASWQDRALLWLALSGAACLLERITRERDPFAGFIQEMKEEKQEDSNVLR